MTVYPLAPTETPSSPLLHGDRRLDTGGQHLYPATPAQHAELLHPLSSPGQVVVARKSPEPPHWTEEAWRPWELDAVLYDAAGAHDLYLTQNRFKGRRRLIGELRELGALFSDLDFYGVAELAGKAPEAVLEMALVRLELAGIPEPSLAICSGQGMYVVWLHTPAGRPETGRWNRCQRRIYEVLKPLGADPQSLDPARVLRLVGTTNSKNDGFVYTLQGSGEARSFEELAEVIAPVTDEEPEHDADLYDIRVQRVSRRPRTGKPGPNGWTVETLWEARLTDLDTLRRLRYGEDRMGDFRDRWLFLSGVAMSWLVMRPEVLERELLALAEKQGGWDERWTRNKMHAVFKRNRMYWRGEAVTWEGVEVDPRYRFQNSRIMELMEVSADEERHMQTLISSAEKYRRKLQREAEERRAAGVVARAEYLEVAARNRAEAHSLRAEGLSLRKIAARLDVSKSQVHRLLSSECPGCTPLYGGGEAPPGGLE